MACNNIAHFSCMGFLLVANANNTPTGSFLLCCSRINTALETDTGPPQIHLGLVWNIIFLRDSVM